MAEAAKTLTTEPLIWYAYRARALPVPANAVMHGEDDYPVVTLIYENKNHDLDHRKPTRNTNLAIVRWDGQVYGLPEFCDAE